MKITFQNACGKPFQSSNSGSAKSQIFTATSSPSWAHLPLHGHIYPFMATSSPSWAHLPSWHIFPFMGTSSPSWVHLPLHGHLFPFMGASSPSWAHPSREGILCRNGYRLVIVLVIVQNRKHFRKNKLHDITPCKKYRTSDNILVLGIYN